MKSLKPFLTGVERTFGQDEVIVSKTDLKGRITYANRVFQRVALYKEEELLGKPHNIIRHPDMPRCVFKFMWNTIQAGDGIFAYVVNRASNGDHYWVFAHVTPTFDDDGQIISYHSNRRLPARSAINKIKPVYNLLLREERRHSTPREQWQASLPMFVDYLNQAKVSYEEFVLTLA